MTQTDWRETTPHAYRAPEKADVTCAPQRWQRSADESDEWQAGPWDPRLRAGEIILNLGGSGGFRGVCLCQKSSSGLLNQHFTVLYVNYTAVKET